jgi:hypothetical protein
MDRSSSDSESGDSSDVESGSSMDWDDFRASAVEYARDDGGVLLRSAEDIRSNRSLCALSLPQPVVCALGPKSSLAVGCMLLIYCIDTRCVNETTLLSRQDVFAPAAASDVVCGSLQAA